MTAPPPLVLPAPTRRALIALAGLGTASAAIGAAVAPDRMWINWLLVSYYAVGLALGGLCMVALHYVTGASWSTAIRRIPEALAGLLPLAVVALAVPLLVRPELYPWAAGEFGIPPGAEADFRRWWLDWPFFVARTAGYGLIWTVFALAIRRQSRLQDGDQDPRHTQHNTRWSAAFLVVFGLTFTLASFDWLMSLEPAWYSTIFAIYNFAGLFLAALAASIVVAVWLERAGPLRTFLSDEHLHDLGKLLFAFSTFWMYIWFSQYMLIWYANITEETGYFVARTSGAWFALLLLNVALNWGVPFLVLLRRDMKRWRTTLVAVAVVVLIGRWLDLYLMLLPTLVESPGLGPWEIGLLAGGVGWFGLGLAWMLRRAPAVPLGDPRLAESLRYEH